MEGGRKPHGAPREGGNHEDAGEDETDDVRDRARGDVEDEEEEVVVVEERPVVQSKMVLLGRLLRERRYNT